jgi:hypothetical protein
MFFASGGNGRVLIRFKDPETMAAIFEELAQKLRSNKWCEYWLELENISSKLICDGELLLDDEFVDVDEWRKMRDDLCNSE